MVLDPTIKEVGAKLLVKDIIENFLRGVDTNFDTIMSSMNELFNFIKKIGSSNTDSNVQQASTFHINPAYLLLLKGKGIVSNIDTNRNEL